MQQTGSFPCDGFCLVRRPKSCVQSNQAMIAPAFPSSRSTTAIAPSRTQCIAPTVRANTKDDDKSILFRPSRAVMFSNSLSIPGFLSSRIGLTWCQIKSDLRANSNTQADFQRTLNHLAVFVEVDVVGSAEQPRHGSGILIGQPLTAGFRRRLFICPESKRLLWINQ